MTKFAHKTFNMHANETFSMNAHKTCSFHAHITFSIHAHKTFSMHAHRTFSMRISQHIKSAVNTSKVPVLIIFTLLLYSRLQLPNGTKRSYKAID